jgi:hypothetical protein
VSCEIVTAGFDPRVAILDSRTRRHFLAAVRKGPLSRARVGEAAYPEDGLTAAALLATARGRLRRRASTFTRESRCGAQRGFDPRRSRTLLPLRRSPKWLLLWETIRVWRSTRRQSLRRESA